MSPKKTASKLVFEKVSDLSRVVLDQAIDGVGPFLGAEKLGEEYLKKPYSSNEERVRALIFAESARNFGTGFLTGLGGVFNLPVSIPGGLAASWVIQARLVGAIAYIYGHDLKNDRVRTLIFLILLGQTMGEALKEVGVTATSRITLALIEKIPAKLLSDLNTRIGVRLLSRVGGRGAINLSKIVPLVGGVTSGAFDAYLCRRIGRLADRLLK